ncbi:MAG: addiction module protein [Verrucomicrobiota bacterium]
MNAEFAPIFRLSCAEKLQLVEDLWDSIAEESEKIPVHSWQIAEVERIDAEISKDPESRLTWEQVTDFVRRHD